MKFTIWTYWVKKVSVLIYSFQIGKKQCEKRSSWATSLGDNAKQASKSSTPFSLILGIISVLAVRRSCSNCFFHELHLTLAKQAISHQASHNGLKPWKHMSGHPGCTCWVPKSSACGHEQPRWVLHSQEAGLMEALKQGFSKLQFAELRDQSWFRISGVFLCPPNHAGPARSKIDHDKSRQMRVQDNTGS